MKKVEELSSIIFIYEQLSGVGFETSLDVNQVYSFDDKNIEKLKQSSAYKSALYYDALKSVH